MGGYTVEVAAERAGVQPVEVDRLTKLGILSDDADGYGDADVRRVQIIQTLERSGLAAEDVAGLLRSGRLSFEFLDQAGYTVFSALSDTTFADLGRRTGIPAEQLTALRAVTGGKTPTPADRVREDELEIMPLVEFQLELGFRWEAVERALRVYGDSLRRIAEGEAEWWRSEVQGPMLASGVPVGELARHAGEISPRLSEASDRAVMAIYHAQQMHVWSVNIVEGIAAALEQAGLHTREERQPAMCFLDVTGYTRLTQERGDVAAAQLIERLSRIVQRISVERGGRPVKWLGDGVMFHFPDPGDGVLAAVEMVAELRDAGLPPAHVGLHAGPVVFQEGDYYGQTVNVAARIGEFARPGEVLVSRAVVDVTDADGIGFESVGEVALRGVAGLFELYAAVTRRPGASAAH